MITVAITNRQKKLRIDRKRMRGAIQAIVGDAGVKNAKIGVAVVDDQAIAKLHGEFLNDPEPTDVLSFVLERSERSLEGEVVASAETALANGAKYGCSAESELLLYVIHGTLHLVGYDDTTPRKRAAMRKKEQEYTGQRKSIEVTTEARRRTGKSQNPNRRGRREKKQSVFD